MNGTAAGVKNSLKVANGESNNVRKKRSIERGLKNVGNKIKYKGSKEKPLRKLAGLGTGLIGAGAAMTAAGIAGITSGDPSKAAQYMITAGMGGYKLGTEVPNVVTDLASSGGEYLEAFKDGYYDYDELLDRDVKKKFKEIRNDADFRRKMEINLQKLQINDDPEEVFDVIGEDGAKFDFSPEGYTAAYKLIQEGTEKSEAMREVKFVETYGKDTNSLSHKDNEDLNKTLLDNIMKYNDIPEKEAEQKKTKLRNSIDYVSGLLH